MPWTDLFVRDSLQDNAITPSPGYPYTSPDLICTQQTTYPNPTQTFTGNYASDPNQAAIANQNNYFYTRAKNLGAPTQGGTMYLYWCPTSLVMTPSQWISRPMYIVLSNGQQQNFASLPAVASNAISVQQTPFVWQAPARSSYCAVGICSTASHSWNPSTPPTFANWEAFVMWVRNNQNICWRNLQMVTNPNTPEWDSTAAFNNQWNASAPLLVGAQCANVPVGTTVTLRCSALTGFDTTATVQSPSETIYSRGATCPANFSGYIETLAQTPGGSAWPNNASILTSAMLGAASSHPVAQFAVDFGDHASHPHVVEALQLTHQGNGVLVVVGTNMIAVRAPN
jgi:hypothetical protein